MARQGCPDICRDLMTNAKRKAVTRKRTTPVVFPDCREPAAGTPEPEGEPLPAFTLHKLFAILGISGSESSSLVTCRYEAVCSLLEGLTADSRVPNPFGPSGTSNFSKFMGGNRNRTDPGRVVYSTCLKELSDSLSSNALREYPDGPVPLKLTGPELLLARLQALSEGVNIPDRVKKEYPPFTGENVAKILYGPDSLYGGLSPAEDTEPLAGILTLTLSGASHPDFAAYGLFLLLLLGLYGPFYSDRSYGISRYFDLENAMNITGSFRRKMEQAHREKARLVRIGTALPEKYGGSYHGAMMSEDGLSVIRFRLWLCTDNHTAKAYIGYQVKKKWFFYAGEAVSQTGIVLCTTVHSSLADIPAEIRDSAGLKVTPSELKKEVSPTPLLLLFNAYDAGISYRKGMVCTVFGPYHTMTVKNFVLFRRHPNSRCTDNVLVGMLNYVETELLIRDSYLEDPGSQFSSEEKALIRSFLTKEEIKDHLQLEMVYRLDLASLKTLIKKPRNAREAMKLIRACALASSVSESKLQVQGIYNRDALFSEQAFIYELVDP